MTNTITAEIHRLLEANQAKQREIDQLRDAVNKAENDYRDRQRAWEQAERERKQRLVDREDYRKNPSFASGMFDRFTTGTDEVRDVIFDAAHQLMPFDHPEIPRPYPYQPYLPWEARVVTLGAFLNIGGHPDRHPRLSMYDSTFDQHWYVFRHGTRAMDFGADWLSRLDDINDHLNARREVPLDWRIEKIDPVTVLLSAHTPLPSSLAIDRADLVPLSLLLGTDLDTRTPLYLPFATTLHTLVCGMVGSGKTNCLHVLVRGVLGNLDQVHRLILVDPKQGVGFARYADLGLDKVDVISTVDQLGERLERLRIEIDARNAALAKARLDTTDDFIFLVIDELSSVVAKPIGAAKEERDWHNRLLANLIYIADQGRSAGLRMIATSLRVNEDAIPTAFRSAFSTIIAFRLMINQHVSTLFDGGLQDLPARLSKLPTGRAVVATDKGRHLVQVPMIKPGPIELADYTALPPPAPQAQIAAPDAADQPPVENIGATAGHYAIVAALAGGTP